MNPSDPGTSRRELLALGVQGSLGAAAWALFPASARADQKTYASREGKARQVIQIFLPGGLAHQDSFDVKPHAPLEYRGETRSLATKVDGLVFSSHLKRTAALADRLCVVRSMTHSEAAHERGVHNMFTGYAPSPAVRFPSFGSVIAHELGPRQDLPPYVCIPNMPNQFAGPGYLSTAYGPFSLGGDPASKGFKVRDLNLAKGVDRKRFGRRRELLDLINGRFTSSFPKGTEPDALQAMDSFYERAYALLDSSRARAAFDLAKEPKALRDRYGRHQAGQRFILARRLVEAGVRWVTVTYGSWDHHDKIREGLARQLPPFDQAFAALIQDLESRGLLDSTLVLVTSEFGRTPKINATGGRDHWPKVFSTVLCGGGVKRGLAYGRSDETSAEPADDPVSVADWATTVYHLAGITADKELMAPGARPVEIVKGGRVRKGLLA
ncbi:MAG: DUF1501 domain-containing protein [Planctomycetes bacterium]|nr:DUF1501 domain-containing protein [Planctomycetota bacterium]